MHRSPRKLLLRCLMIRGYRALRRSRSRGPRLLLLVLLLRLCMCMCECLLLLGARACRSRLLLCRRRCRSNAVSRSRPSRPRWVQPLHVARGDEPALAARANTAPPDALQGQQTGRDHLQYGIHSRDPLICVLQAMERFSLPIRIRVVKNLQLLPLIDAQLT